MESYIFLLASGHPLSLIITTLASHHSKALHSSNRPCFEHHSIGLLPSSQPSTAAIDLAWITVGLACYHSHHPLQQQQTQHP
jgi:hypothetical protein